MTARFLFCNTLDSVGRCAFLNTLCAKPMGLVKLADTTLDVRACQTLVEFFLTAFLN